MLSTSIRFLRVFRGIAEYMTSNDGSGTRRRMNLLKLTDLLDKGVVQVIVRVDKAIPHRIQHMAMPVPLRNSKVIEFVSVNYFT